MKKTFAAVYARLRWVVLFVLLAVLFYKVRALYVPEPDALTLHHNTERYAFRSDLDAKTLERHARFFEAFSTWFSSRYFAVHQDKPLKVYLFGTRRGYARFCRGFRGKDFSPFGFYVPHQNIIVLNYESGLGTAGHELVHHFIENGFEEEPAPWINEGFASFFEKMIGRFDEQGQFSLSVGYLNPRRFQRTLERHAELDLARLAESSEWDQDAARSFMVFLHRHGTLTPFIQQLAKRSGDSKGLLTLEAVYGKPVSQINSEWKAWVLEQSSADIRLLPRSFVKTAPEWQVWRTQTRSKLRWNEKRARFEPIPEPGVRVPPE